MTNFRKVLFSMTMLCAAQILTTGWAQTNASGAAPLANSLSPIGQFDRGVVRVLELKDLPAHSQQMFRQQMSGMKSGYEEVPNEVIDALRNFSIRMHKVGASEASISVRLGNPISLQSRGYQYLGFVPEGPTKSGPWTRVSRIFGNSAGDYIFLHEWDFVKDGGSVYFIKEMLNHEVNGVPARLSRKRNSKNEVLTELSWAANGKFYTLTSLRDLPDTPSEKTSGSAGSSIDTVSDFVGVARGIN